MQIQKMRNRSMAHAISICVRSGRVAIARAIGVHALLAATILTAIGCADPSAPPNSYPPMEEVLASIAVSTEAVILAVGDSLQITASAKNIFGESLPLGSGMPVAWQSQASKTVSVDSNGVLHALKATSEDEYITITAKWTYGGVTSTAEVLANVTATQQPIAGIRVVSSDSARSGWVEPLSGSLSGVSVTTVDADGRQIGIPRIPLTLHDSMPTGTISTIFLGRIGALVGLGQYAVMSRAVGEFWLYAQSTVYGVVMRDSLRFTGLYPALAEIPIIQDSSSNALISKFSGQEVFVQPCGLVHFKNVSNMPIDIVFDDSTAAAKCVPVDQAGNILNLNTNQTATRKFPAVGTVRWTVRDPATGTLLTRVSGKITMKVP